MRNFLPVIACICILFPFNLWSQCPPAGFPQPGNTCVTAPILCENLDGYCATINNSNTTQNFPGCPGWQLNNDEWFAFFAGSTTITVVVTPSNCSPGGNQGLQGGIYAACTSQAMDLQCSCTTNPFTLTSNNYVIGQVYYFVLDGCGGNVCDYSIDVTQGSTVGVPPDAPGPISGNTTVCAGASNTYSISPVYAATNYNWTLTPNIGTITGNGTNNISVNWGAGASGPVQLCVTASNACYSNTTPSCYDINVTPVPTATLSGSGIICNNGGGTVNLSVAFTGTGPWTFVYTQNGVPQSPITTSDNPYTLTVNQAGNYGLQSVTSTTGNCAGTVSGTAQVAPVNINPTATAVNATCGQSNGSINLSPGGGNAPHQFNWSSGQNTEDLADIPAGSYTVTVTDDNGCTGTTSVTVADNPINFTISGTVTANTTCTGGNGAITVSVTPSGTYTYNWSSGENSQNLTDLVPGTYTVSVTTGVNCTQTASFTVPDQPNQPSITSTVVNTTCELDNGSINVTVSGGIAPYTYDWGGGVTSEDLNNIPAGTYVVTVTGANGCTQTSSITVSNTNPPFTITPTIVANTTCNGGNGSITLNVSPAGSYTFNWEIGNMTNSLTGLTPGTYNVTVSAGGACTQATGFTVPDQPNTPTINSTVVNTTCELDNGSINVTVSGGVPPYTYTWGGGQSTEDLSAIPAGTYDLTVTGANGCTQTASISVNNTNPPFTINPTVTSNTTCNGGNGAITVTVTPGGSYTYLWSTGDATPNISGLIPGTYTVTVNGGGACTQTLEVNVPDNPNNPNISFNTTESTCDLANGAINVTVSGGISPYTFAWLGGQTTEDLSNIPAGAYSLTVTGANGCTDVADITVDNDNPTFSVNAAILPNTNCNGTGNGSINLSVVPTGSYTFNWSNGSTGSTLSNLLAGTQTVTVSAGGSCIQVLDFTVTDEPNNPLLNFTVVNANCGLSNGSVNLTVSNGTLPYTYMWSNGAVSQDLNGVPSDAYFVTVTGSNGCSEVDFVTVDDDEIQISISADIVNNTSCVNPRNGRISLFVTPPGLSVSWSTGSNATILNNLAPGDYTVTVSAGGTCTEVQTFTVEDNSELPVLIGDAVPAVCDLPNGSIDLEPDFGVPPYTYNWSNGLNVQDVNNLLAGNYTVTVTSALGCSEIGFFNVPDNDLPITIFGIIDDNTRCITPFDGSISLDFDPPGYPYTVQWAHGPTNLNLSFLASGTYTVTATVGTCTATETFSVANVATAPNLSLSGTAATCGQSNGSATATASGGVTPYAYKWSHGPTSQTVNNLAPGTYTATVTGANGCSAVNSVIIANNTFTPVISGVVVDNTSCLSGNGSISLTVTPSGAYTYFWNGGLNTANIINLNEGNYTVTVSAGIGCSASASFSVLKNTSDPVLNLSISPDTCNQSIGAINLDVSGATTPYVYAWSNSALTEDIANLPANVYTVTVTGANSCTATAVANVPNNSSTFSLGGTVSALSNCAAANGAIDLAITPPGAYTIEWSTMASTEDVSGLVDGTYTVTVTQSGTCSASTTFVVLDGRSFPTLNLSTTPEVCGLQNGGIDVTVNGGLMPYGFTWSGGQNTEDIIGQVSGDYTVTVTGANACTATASANIPANSISFTVNGVTQTNTACIVNNGAIDLTVTPAGVYTYLWTGGSMSEDLIAIVGGQYTVTVSAGGNCTAVASYTVADNTLAPNISGSITAALCGKSNGAIDLSVSGGQGPFIYNWSLVGSGEDVSNLPAGDYTVTVTGSNGCSAVRIFTVPDNAFSPNVSGVVTDNTSCTTPNGSIVTSVAPADTYTYIWDGGQSSSSLSNLPAGTYTVTVSAGGACTAVVGFTVVNDTQAPILDGVVVNALCSQATGSIDLSVSGAVTPYSYTWSNSALTEDINALLPGIYTVLVTGANNCTATASWVVDNESNNFTIAEFITPNTACVGTNGSISISMAPAGAYTFNWSNSAQTEDLNGLAPGIYTVTVTDAAACAISQVYTVGSAVVIPSLAGTVTDIACFGQSVGAIDVANTNGIPPLQYSWLPVQAGNPQDLNQVPAGTYALTMTDAVGCTATASFVVDQPANGLQIACDASATISMPGATDGAGAVSIFGGTPPYAVIWNPGGIQTNVTPGTFTINNLGEGSYAVTVSDANNCTQACGFNVGLVDCETGVGTMSSVTVQICGPDCVTAAYNPFGQMLDPDDVLQFILHTGNANQIVDEIARNNQPEFCFDPLTMVFGQTYYISAVAGTNDGAGNVLLGDYCTVVSFGTPIIFRPQPVATIAPPGVLNCIVTSVPLLGQSDLAGSSYNWYLTGAGQIIGNTSQPTVQAAAAGQYFLAVSLNGCADTAQVAVQNISNAIIANITADPDDILDCAIDRIILSGVVEGSLNANTIWIGNGQVFANGTAVDINAPGLYEFIAIDTLTQCSDTASIQIDQNLVFPSLFVNQPDDLTCVRLSVPLSGGSPFPGIQFQWVKISGTDTILIGNGPTVNVSTPGVYYLQGTDPVNGCRNLINVSVAADLQYPVADAGTPFSIDCFGEIASLDGSNSSGAPDMQFAWLTSDGFLVSGNNTPTPTINLPGTYRLVVSNPGNGCTDSDTVLISPDAPIPYFTVLQPPCFGDKGRLRIDSVVGGAPPVRFSLNGQVFTTQTLFTNLSDGTYNLAVEDAQGCSASASFEVIEPPLFEITVLQDTRIKWGDSTLIVVSTNFPDSDIASVQWTPGAFLSCDTCLITLARPLTTTNFTLEVVTENGCADRAFVLVRVDTRLNIYAPNVFSPDQTNNNWFTLFADPEIDLDIKTLQVYSRWGEQVFVRNNFKPNIPELGWNGKHQGESLNPAVFVWYAVLVAPDGSEVVLKGDVLLNR